MRALVRALARLANTLYCPRCGHGNPMGTPYCKACGAKLS